MTDYFVRIDDGKNVRKELLESSKFCIQVLKQDHHLVELRESKRKLVAKVRTDMKELVFLLGELEKVLPILTKKELKEMFPERYKRAAPEKVIKTKKGKSKVVKTAVKVVAPIENETTRELSKLERLERSLEMIEGRLDKL